MRACACEKNKGKVAVDECTVRATNSSFATRLLGRRSFIHASRTSPTSSRRTAIRHQSKLEETLAGSPHCRRAGPSACAAAPRRPSTRGAKMGQVPELGVPLGRGHVPVPEPDGERQLHLLLPQRLKLTLRRRRCAPSRRPIPAPPCTQPPRPPPAPIRTHARPCTVVCLPCSPAPALR